MSTGSPVLPASLERLLADTPEIYTLDNGLTVVTHQDLAHPLASVQVWVRTGSIHEADRPGSGLSHYLEHMLFKGTSRRPAGTIAAEVQAFGGQINAYTAFDRTVYYIDGPAEGLEKSLDILADMCLSSTLLPEATAAEKDVILREIDMTLDDPDRILSRSLFSTAYREHPFRYPVIGLRPLFEQVDRDCLAAYYRARYQPANMVLSVSGHFDADQLHQWVEASFGNAPRANLQSVAVPAEPVQLAMRESRIYGDYQAARGYIAFKIPGLRHPDAPALDILASVIGSGHSGRLRQRLREELEIVHSISASAWNPGDPGLLAIHFTCEPARITEAEQAILQTCREFSTTGFNREEIEKARRFAYVSEVQARQTTSGMAARMGLLAGVVGDLHYPETYFRRIQEVNADQLTDLAGAICKQSAMTLTTLLPESARPKARMRTAGEALPPFSCRELSNGARIIWQRDARLPRCYLRFAGLGGPLHEPAELAGVTSIMATLLNRDTRTRAAAEIAAELESGGGFMADSSGNNSFALSLELMPEAIDTGLRALRGALTEPAFLDTAFNRERAAQISSLQEMEDDVLDFGRLALRKHFFGEHPFSHHPYGSEASMRALDPAAVRAHYRRLVTGPNAVISIAGDFDPEQVLPKIETLLLDLPADPLPPHGNLTTLPARTGEVTLTMDREQAVLFQAYPDVGFRPDSDLAGELMDEMLSDMSGPLYQTVREERSLAYFVGASRLLGAEFGCFYLFAGTQPERAAEVFACFDEQLERIRNGDINLDRFNAAKTRLMVQNRSSLQGPAMRAARAALNVLHDKPIMDWLDFDTRLAAITPAQVTDFARNILSEDKRLRLSVMPEID